MKFTKKQNIEKTVLTESIKEAVDNKRTYDAFDVYQIVEKTLNEQLNYNITEEQGWDIEDIFKSYANKESGEIYAEDVDKGLEVLCDKYKLSPEELSIIEQEIMKSDFDYAKDRKRDFNSDIDKFRDNVQDIQYKLDDLKNDIFELENQSVIIGDRLNPILKKLEPILNELKLEIIDLYNMNYTGLEK